MAMACMDGDAAETDVLYRRVQRHRGRATGALEQQQDERLSGDAA